MYSFVPQMFLNMGTLGQVPCQTLHSNVYASDSNVVQRQMKINITFCRKERLQMNKWVNKNNLFMVEH